MSHRCGNLRDNSPCGTFAVRDSLFVKGLAVMRKSTVVSMLLAPSLALASGYSLPNTNPRDLAMSASTVAAQRDSGAAFALPAALARLEGPSLRIAGGGVNVYNTWKDPTNGVPGPAGAVGPDTDMDGVISAIGNVSVAYGGKLTMFGNRGWGVGLGVQPFGGAIVNWPDDWTGRFRIVEVDRKSFSGIVSAGIEVLPRVRVGAGFLYYYTTQEFTQKTFLGPAGEAEATLDMDGGAPSFSASLEVDPIADLPLTIAVDYKHKATQDLDGDVKWTGLPPGASLLNPILQDQGVKETLTIPNLLNIGLAYRVAKPLLITATFTWDRWVVYDQDQFIGDAPGAQLAVPRDYSNGQTYRAGVEYDLTPAWQVRAGVQRDESGLSTDTYSPTLPDGSSWAGSLGGTYKFGRGFSVDAAVFYAMMDDVTSTKNSATEPPLPTDPGTFRGKYSPSALVYGLSVGWQPTAAR
jgi:long-chain fatty acid transport protein